MASYQGRIRTPCGQAYVLDDRIQPQIPLLHPNELAHILAVANPDLPFTAFSSSNIASVYDSLAQKFYAEEEAGDPNRLQSKQAVDKVDEFTLRST